MKVIYVSNEISNFEYYDTLFKNKEEIYNFNLAEVVSDNKFNCKDYKFDSKINANLYLNYPLNVVIENNITFNTLHELISKIRDTYNQIYDTKNKENKYGIWGHSIWDLVIENITIYRDNDTILVSVFIGS